MTARSEVERIATLEAEMRGMKDDVHATRKKVDEMHDLLMQAKGARWAIIAVASLTGFLAGTVGKWLPFINMGPR